MTQKRALDLVADAKSRIENLTVDQVAEELDRGGVVLVDLREQNERQLHVSTRPEACSSSGPIRQSRFTVRSSTRTGG